MLRSPSLGITEWPSHLPAAHLPTSFEHDGLGFSGRVPFHYSLRFNQDVSNSIPRIIVVAHGDRLFDAEQPFGISSPKLLQTRHLRFPWPSASRISVEFNHSNIRFSHGTISVAHRPWPFIPESTSPTSSSGLFQTRHLRVSAGCLFMILWIRQDTPIITHRMLSLTVVGHCRVTLPQLIPILSASYDD